MKLYDVPRGSRIRVVADVAIPPAAPPIDEGEILKFSRIDGMYSECFNKDGERVYLSAVADVEIVAWKLFRVKKNGALTSLFINKSKELPIEEWMNAESIKTKGFAYREGWHCTPEPIAPHLKENLKNGEKRVWRMVAIEGVTEIFRPKSQGGTWYLASRMKILK